MQIRLNGSEYRVTQGITTIQQLLEYLQLHQRVLMVEYNGKVLQKEDYRSTPISDGDTIEMVHFVGGG